VSGDLTPQRRDLRLSDAERERVVARLQVAVTEGRLTLDEFQERVDGVLNARTYGEIEPYLADLPVSAAQPLAAREELELRATATSLRRRGGWVVPRKLIVRNRAGTTKLDFTEAAISFPVINVVLDVWAGSTILVLPAGASVDADAVEMAAGSLTVRRLATAREPASGPHFVVSGNSRAGSVTIRPQRRFWRWRW
jgi:hypothetical protein